MSTALLFIATGPKYWDFALAMIQSAQEFLFPHDVVMFTDRPDRFDVEHQIDIPPAGYPAATLNRYHTFLSQDSLLSQYDYLFYSDVDMRFVAPVSESDILSDGITATLHPGFAVQREPSRRHRYLLPTVGTPERRIESACYIPKTASNKYFCGGFNGGTSSSFLEMAANIRCMINNDADIGVVPIWHDESALVKYLWVNPPARILTPSFCYPENYKGEYGWLATQFPPVLLALNKDQSDRWGTR